jgi:hypothetical protein
VVPICPSSRSSLASTSRTWLLEIIDLSATLHLGIFFLIFFNLSRGDIFLDCWVTGGVLLGKVMAAQFCTVAVFSQAPG